MWKINAGRRSVMGRQFVEQEVVGIGWSEAGNHIEAGTKDALIQRLAEAYPDRSDQQNQVGASQIWRFLTEVKIGDDVITYDPGDRLYHLGTVTGAPEYRPDIMPSLPIVRRVRWAAHVSRDALSTAARGRLGAILTLFKVHDVAAQELRDLAEGRAPAAAPIADDLEDALAASEDPFADIEDLALERVKDRLLALGWEEMQEIVAALLRSLGYRTIVSPTGPDRGKDIIASRDGFGFEAPRIVVEVKHRRGQMGAPEIRAFLGGRHAEDRGLYVSTGGFTREAYFEGERASNVTHLMTLDGLARALLANYETIDSHGRALLPLTRIYWPA